MRLDEYREAASIPRDCPWVDPPRWWDQGLAAWGELLTRLWEEAGRKVRGSESARMAAVMGRQFKAELTETAIEALLSSEDSRDAPEANE